MFHPQSLRKYTISFGYEPLHACIYLSCFMVLSLGTKVLSRYIDTLDKVQFCLPLSEEFLEERSCRRSKNDGLQRQPYPVEIHLYILAWNMNVGMDPNLVTLSVTEINKTSQVIVKSCTHVSQPLLSLTTFGSNQ